MTLVERNRPIVLGVYKQRKSGAGAQSPPLKLLIHREPADANGGHSGTSRQALVTADGSSVSATLAANKV